MSARVCGCVRACAGARARGRVRARVRRCVRACASACERDRAGGALNPKSEVGLGEH